MDELHYPTTRYILAKYVLKIPLGEDAPGWACGRLMAGDDTLHLVLLAGMTGREIACEVDDCFRSCIQELNLKLPEIDKATIDYAQEISRLYLDGRLTLGHYFQKFLEFHTLNSAPTVLEGFYQLAWTWHDFETQDFPGSFDLDLVGFHEDLAREINQLIAIKTDHD